MIFKKKNIRSPLSKVSFKNPYAKFQSTKNKNSNFKPKHKKSHSNNIPKDFIKKNILFKLKVNHNRNYSMSNQMIQYSKKASQKSKYKKHKKNALSLQNSNIIMINKFQFPFQAVNTPLSQKNTPKIKQSLKSFDQENLNQDDQKTLNYNYPKKKKSQVNLIKRIKRYIKVNKNIPQTQLSFYKIIKLLGEGSYGKVYLAKSILLDKKVAIKAYEKQKFKINQNWNRVFQEIEILSQMNNKNIIKMYEIFDNNQFLFIVLQYSNKGDLLKQLKKKGKFKESQFLPIFKQIIQGLKYLKRNKILHRDIKLDNILIDKKQQVKICDFGISKKMGKKLINEHIGTPAYMAPEIIRNKGYKGYQVDMWSLGIMSFIILTGKMPLKGDQIQGLHQSILKQDIDFSNLDHLSFKFKFIIQNILKRDPEERLTIEEIIQILGIDDVKQKQKKKYVDKQMIETMKEFGFSKKQIKRTIKEKLMNHISALIQIINEQIIIILYFCDKLLNFGIDLISLF